jgi:hypothetical protein
MQRRHRRLGLTVTAAALALLAVSGCGTGDVGSRPAAAEGWRRLAAAPLSPRVGHSAVWTGSELLVWGGRVPGGAPKADGAAYDPARDRWRRLPSAPLAGRFGHAVVLADGTLAAFTYRDSERACHGGLYDLAAGTWRRVGSCPLLPIMYPQPIWTGSRIVLLAWGPEWFDGGEGNPWPERVYTNGIYDPASDTWKRPAARPDGLQPGYGGQFVWTGREVLLWGLGGGVAYDPSANSWRPMAETPFQREFPTSTWTGAELLIWGGTTGDDCVDGCPRADGLAYQPGSG